MQQHEQPLAPMSNEAPHPSAEYGAHQPAPAAGVPNGGVAPGPAAHGAGAAPAAAPVSHHMGLKEAKSLHKTLEKEGAAEDSHIKHQVKEIAKAEKAERKAEKADTKAMKEKSKAESHMHSANKELERAQAKHDQAVREAQKALNEVDIKKQHHGQVSQHVQETKVALDQLTDARKVHSEDRSRRMGELESIIDAAKSK